LRVIEAVPFSQVDYEDAKLFGDGDGAVMSAVHFFIQCRMSRSGGMKSFATISRNRVRRGMNEQASAWLNAVDGLAEVHARLRRVVILNDDALKVIAQQDGPNTLYFLDPPYLPEVRTADLYAHEMTFGQHCELLTLLSTIQGRFVLSGYHCPLYDNWAAKFGWRVAEFDCSNNMAAGDVKDRRTEVCWMNYGK
jgi:DNA adenine methylase